MKNNLKLFDSKQNVKAVKDKKNSTEISFKNSLI